MPKVGQIYAHRFVVAGGPSDTPQAVNRFEVVEVTDEYVATRREATREEPTRWAAGTFDTLFQRVKGKAKKSLL